MLTNHFMLNKHTFRFRNFEMLSRFILHVRSYSSLPSSKTILNNEEYLVDSFTNVTNQILSHVNKKLYMQKGHPLCLIKERIVHFFYDSFKGRTGNSLFSVVDNLNPVVTTYQNFDSLLIPKDHVSRSKSDCYYINKDKLLRSHMTAHQSELVKMGLDNFIMVGDVYRKDTVDMTHYPVFHQLDAVKLFTPQELFLKDDDGQMELNIKEKDPNATRTKEKQESYTQEASKEVEKSLKTTLEALAKAVFGKHVQHRWVDAYFPFTHPSWELEILLGDKWIEVLGCGVMENGILKEAGCGDRIGWAFGLGLERLAMISYRIPDIRIFWSKDSGFLHQFANKTYSDDVVFKPFSIYPQLINDISFWIPENFESNDFYELARELGGNYIEQIDLKDVFKHPKTARTSHMYRIVYRHMSRTLTQDEVDVVHKEIAKQATEKLKVEVR